MIECADTPGAIGSDDSTSTNGLPGPMSSTLVGIRPQAGARASLVTEQLAAETRDVSRKCHESVQEATHEPVGEVAAPMWGRDENQLAHERRRRHEHRSLQEIPIAR